MLICLYLLLLVIRFEANQSKSDPLIRFEANKYSLRYSLIFASKRIKANLTLLFALKRINIRFDIRLYSLQSEYRGHPTLTPSLGAQEPVLH
jgi:hypothetical protein